MAGRIPKRFIEDLVSRVDLVELIGSRVRLKKAGRNYSGLCPFHNEKSPSFTVSPDKQFYHCFGCGANGDAIGFLMAHDHLDFVEAVETLASHIGIEVEREQDVSPQEDARRKAQRQQQLSAQACLQRAADHYRDALQQPQGQMARDYLSQRGLSSEIIERFGLGFAPQAWDDMKQHLAKAGVSEAQQVEYGMLVRHEDSGRTYDRFRHRVMFPIRNPKGEVIAFGGRVLDDSKPKYLNSPETPVFHKGQELYGLYEARQQPGSLDRLLVVEGYMDVVALAQNGIHWAVATLGTSLSEQHLQRIFRLVGEVVFCFDGDRAGAQAAERALQAVLPMMKEGRQARFLFLPEGEDPDSLVRREGRALFSQRVTQALPLAEFLFRHLRQGLDLNLMDDRVQLAEKSIPYLQRLPEGILLRMVLTRLSQLTGLDVADLTHRLQQRQSMVNAPTEAAGADTTQVAPQAYSAASSEPPQKASADQEGRMLALLVHHPGLAHDVPESLSFNSAWGVLLNKVLIFLRTLERPSPQVLMAHWHGTQEGEQLLTLRRRLVPIPFADARLELQALLEHQALQQLDQERKALRHKLRSGELDNEDRQRLWQLERQWHERKRKIGRFVDP